jgi:hypothetical protein
MNDEDNKPANDKSEDQSSVVLPPQALSEATAAWNDRVFTTPAGRLIIETNQGDDSDGRVVIQE